MHSLAVLFTLLFDDYLRVVGVYSSVWFLVKLFILTDVFIKVQNERVLVGSLSGKKSKQILDLMSNCDTLFLILMTLLRTDDSNCCSNISEE